MVRSRETWRLAAVVALLALLGACSSVSTRPDLSRLYMQSTRSPGQPPVVVVHGVLGAKLRDPGSGREYWPGGITRLAFSEFRELALDIDPETLQARSGGLEPYAIFDAAAGQDFYGEILRTLEEAGHYRRTAAGESAVDRARRYYVFLYDWRRDNVESARALDALVERIRADHGRPDLRVDLVAHSNGGLVARYYARYGTADVLDGNEFPVTQAGARKIRRLILLGTPNFGSVASVTGFIEGAKVGFRRIPPEVLATFPTAYQLFPHALSDWLIGGDGEALQRDVFDAEVWRRFQWSVFDPQVRERIVASRGDPVAGEAYLAVLERYFAKHLERARRFTWALTVAEPTRGVRPIVLGGDCELTPARLLVEEDGGDSVLRLWPDDVKHRQPGVDYGMRMLEPGDGTVTKASLLARESLDPTVPRHEYSHFPVDYAFFLCERHDRLTGNPSFQDNLLHALLSVDR
jgi:pimeloyl-ACP methyl ester carboxylesterase